MVRRSLEYTEGRENAIRLGRRRSGFGRGPHDNRRRTAPAAAVRALSEFAATLVDTFSGRLQFVYSPEAARTLGPMMLADASAAINPAYQTRPPAAALRLYVFKAAHAFTLDQFLKGELPAADNVAISETLVRT